MADNTKTMNNIIDDQTIVAQALIGRTQEQLDAYERLMKYAMTLEVQVGCYEDFVDEISWEGTIGVFDQATVDALREDLTVAQQGVEDNYGLLDETEEAVEKRYVDVVTEGGVAFVLRDGAPMPKTPYICCRNCHEGKECYWRQIEIEDRLERL